MRKVIADLVTRFSTTGTAEARRDVEKLGADVKKVMTKTQVRAPLGGLTTGARSATDALKKTHDVASRLARTISMIGGLGGLAGSLGSMATVKRAVDDSQQAIQDLEQIASSMSMTISEASAFRNYTEQYGLQIDDIRQAMQQFYSIAGQAAQGNNEYARTFQALGLDMTDARNRGLGMVELFDRFSKRMRNFSGQQRAYFMSSIFGDDDATKVTKVVDALGRANAPGVRSRLPAGEVSAQYLKMRADMERENAPKDGSLITEDDLTLSREYKQATTTLAQSIRGLQMEIFRAFGKPFIEIMKVAAAYITKYRFYITAYLLVSFRRLVSFVHDFIVIMGNKAPLQTIRNGWLVHLKAVLEVMWSLLRVTGQLIYAVAQFADAMVFRATGMGIVDYLKQLRAEDVIRGLVAMRDAVVQVMRDVMYVLTFQDFNVTTGVGRALLAIRNTVMAALMGLWGEIQPIVSAVIGALSQMFEGVSTGKIDETRDAFYNLGALINVVITYILAFSAAFYEVFVLQQNAVGQFAWLNIVRDWIMNLYAHLKIAIGWFVNLYTAVSDFLAQWGIDLQSTLLFIGLLRLIGAGGLISLVLKAFGGLVSFLFKTFWPAFGAKQGLTAFTGMLKAIMGAGAAFLTWAGTFSLSLIGGIASGIASGGAAIAGAFASLFASGGLVAGAIVAAGVAAGAILAWALQGSFIDKWIQSFTDWWHNVDGAIDKAGRDIRENYEMGTTGIQGSRNTFRPQAPGAAIARANAPAVAPYPSGPAGANGNAGFLGDVNIKVAGETIPARMAPSDYQRMQQRLATKPGSTI